MITYTVHSALYLLQTKISRLLIKRLQNTRYKLQSTCPFTLLDEKYRTFYIKSKFMYVSSTILEYLRKRTKHAMCITPSTDRTYKKMPYL